MSENLPRVQAQGLTITLPSTLGSVNLQQIRYTAAEDLLVVGSTVIHRSDNGLFCLNDLHEALANGEDNKAPNRYLRLESTKAAITRLGDLYGPGVIETVAYGEARGSYAHEELAQDYAAWLDPAYSDLLRAVARKVSVLQIQEMQERLDRISEELGEAKAELIQSKEDLRLTEEDLEDAKAEASFHRSERDSMRRSLKNTRHPDLSKRRDPAIAKANILQSDMMQLEDSATSARVNAGIADSSLERLRRLIPKDQVEAHKELVYARNAVQKAIGYLGGAI